MAPFLKPKGRRVALLAVAIGALCGGLLFYHWWFWYRFADLGMLRESVALSVGKRPVDIDWAAKSEKLYVLDMPKGAPGAVHVVDTRTSALKSSVTLAPGFPRQLDVSQNGSRVVVTVSSYLGGSWGGQKGQNRIDVIDTSTDKVSASIPLPGTGATGVALSADGDTAYVTDRLRDRLFRVDVDKQRIVSELSVARGSWQVTLREDRDLAYVVCCRPAKSVVTVVDTKNNTVLSQIPVDIVRGTWDARATFAPGSERLYVTHALGSTIAVVDCDPESPTYHKQIELIETQGKTLKEMSFNADGTLALVASLDTDELLLLDTNPASPHYHTVVQTLKVGHHPDAVLVVDRHEPRTTVYIAEHGKTTLRILRSGSRS